MIEFVDYRALVELYPVYAAGLGKILWAARNLCKALEKTLGS